MDSNAIAIDRAAVNEVIRANSDELALLHWYDMDEVRRLSQFRGECKDKYPIEIQCFAIGFLTGEQIRDKPWGERHIKWILPVKAYLRTVVSQDGLRWVPSGEYPQNLGGTYPSIEAAEATGYDPEVSGSIREHRRAQIIVGQNNIRTWLERHEQFHPHATEWFTDILHHSGVKASA